MILYVKKGVWLMFIVLLFSCKAGDYKIGNGSMFPNLNVGDIVFVDQENQYTYGDVVVMSIPDSLRIQSELFRIYRVVALPLDTISVNKNHSIINGKECNSSFIENLIDPDGYQTKVEEEELPNKIKIKLWIRSDCPDCDKSNMHSIVVPSGHYFVLGDNRTGAVDSRYIGPVSIESIKGKVTKVIKK